MLTIVTLRNMNIRKHLFKITTLSVALTLCIGVAVYTNTPHKEVDATQYNDNYAPYTYSGDYYNGFNFDATGGMNGALRTSLTTKIKPEKFFTYSGSGEGTLSEELQEADQDPNNSSNMIIFYTRDSIRKTAAGSGNSMVWNREHVWCQSLSNGNWGESQGGTDLLHLRPDYASTNSSRSNTPYGDLNKSNPKYYDPVQKKVVNDSSKMLFGYSNGTWFEPLDCVKGDVARIVMYIWTTYTGWSGYSPLNITTVFQSYDTLLKWHTMDRPDALEGHRNDYVQSTKQKNRNPFVDHPELAWKIFNDANGLSTSVLNQCMAAYPDGGDPIEPTGISLNKTTAEVRVGKTLQLTATLQPYGASGTVTWSSSNTSVASVNNGLVTANAVGTVTITATVGDYSASCVVTVSESNTNYGTEDNPLTITEAKALIDEAGTSPTEEPIYVKGIVSSNSAFNTSYNNYDEIWLQNEDEETPQAFELFRAKVDSNKVSGDYTAANSFKDKEVIAYGYAKKYNSTYELCTSSTEPKNPLVVSVRTLVTTSIELDRSTASIEVGQTTTLVATTTPNNAQVTWLSSDEDVATVSNGVVTGVSAGTAVITAQLSDDVKAQCTVTVTSNGGTANIQIASSIATGDIVYLTANAVSRQYNGPTSASADAYGSYADFGGAKPNTNLLALEVCDGNVTNSYAFKLTSGDYTNKYLAWSNNNTLRVATSVDNNSSWTVAFDQNNNATIANVADSNRIIWYNVNYPRFACYTNKTDGDAYKYIQLWKTAGQAEPSPSDYLCSTQTIKTISGRVDTTDNGVVNGSIVFADLGLNNSQQYLTPFAGTGFTVTFAGGENDGKYYNTGTGIRTYGGGTITIASTGTISQITLTWDSSNKPSNGNVVNTGTYNASTGVWTGSASSVVFTRPSGSGNWRLQSVSVTTTGETVTVDQVALRFGAVIPINDWTTIDDTWGISEYGIVFARQSMLTARGLSSAEAVFRNDVQDVGRVYNDSGSHPNANGDDYIFTARLNLEEEDYDEVFYAAPYIVANGEYYFLQELHYSVRSLAYECLSTHDSSLSEAALTILKGNYSGQ